MIRYFLFSLLLSPFFINAQDTIRLKADIKVGQPGYLDGGAIMAFSDMPDTNPWKKSRRPISGVPNSWGEDFYRKDIWFQTYQYSYQLFKNNLMDSARFTELMSSWEFDTLGSKYTSEWLACYTTIVYHQEDSSRVSYLIDTDGDEDFSDEKLYYAFEKDKVKYNNVTSVLNEIPWVHYELFLNGKIEKDSVPMIVKKGHAEGFGDFLTYNEPIYAEVTANEYHVIVNSSSPDLSYPTISLFDQLDATAERFTAERVNKGKRIKLNDEWFTFVDFERPTQEVLLKRVDVEKDSVYPQEGFYAPPFLEKDIYGGEEISSEELKGKYVLLDFWGTWCKPCVAQIPKMVEIYNEMKGDSFEMISIAAFSNGDKIRELKKTHGMDWKHITSVTEDQGILGDYYINKYPTLFLIDPAGKIIAEDPSLEKIKELMNKGTRD